MILEHLRFRQRVSLLALGALAGSERAETDGHVARCERCRREVEALRALHETLLADPARSAEPDLPLPALVARVEAKVTETLAGRRARRAWALGAGLPAAAAAVLAAGLLLPRLVSRLLPRPAGSPTAEVVSPEAPGVSAAAMARLERTVAREQTARYLTDAGDVLVAVAAAPSDCDREDERVDVGAASARSRELLARRALVVDAAPQSVASARPVLDDVEQALREVASLESCVRRRDVERLRDDVERRRLLMRIRLMTRELEG